MKRKNNAFASPVNAPLSFQALQAADFPLKNRAKLCRSQSNNQEQSQQGTRQSGSGTHAGVSELEDGRGAGSAGEAAALNARILVNSSVPASLFTTTAASTQLPEPDESHSSGARLHETLLPADLGILRPTAAQRMPQHGLPSGTHIRRRPRSVARPGAGAHGGRHTTGAAAAGREGGTAAGGAGATSAAAGGMSNASLGASPQAAFGSPHQVFIAPPAKGVAGAGGGSGGGDTLARSYMSSELLSLVPAPASEEVGAAAPSGGAGKARVGHDAKPLKYVRRAAPSPAPSRPVRANRRRPLPNTTLTASAAVTSTSGSPTEHTLGGGGNSDVWADAEVVGRQPRPLSRFTLPLSGNSADADHVVLGNSGRDDEARDGGGHGPHIPSSGATPFTREVRPRSARRLAALADAPSSSSTPASRASETLDFYLTLCTEVGEAPSGEWVRALIDASREGGAASGPRKTRKEPLTAEVTKSNAAATAGPSRRTKSPGAGGGRPALKRSSSSGVGTRAAGTTSASTSVGPASTSAPGGGQRPPLTRKANTAAPTSIEDEVRLYCKTHLYPCLQKIGTIEKYCTSLTETLEDFKSVCEELPPTEAATKALLAAEVSQTTHTGNATSGTNKGGRSGRSGRSGGQALTSAQRLSAQDGVATPPTESLSGTVNSEAPSSLNQIAARLSLNLAKMQEGAAALLLTLAEYAKEARRPIGSVGGDDTSRATTTKSGVAEAGHEALSEPQGFTKRLAREEIKTARLLESIRAEIESTLATKPCVRVEDASLFQTPLLFSAGTTPTPSAAGGHPRTLGESGRASTLSHRSGTTAAHNQHTPRGGLSSSAAPDSSLLSPSPMGTRRHSAATSDRQHLPRGSVVSPSRPMLAPVVKLVMPAPSSRRSSVHNEPAKLGAMHDSPDHPRVPGSGGSRGSNHTSENTVLFVITSQTSPSTAGAPFSRRGSFDSVSSAASQTASPGHTSHHATAGTGASTRVERAGASRTAVGGAGRSRSASAGAGKKARSGGAAIKRSGSVKTGSTRAATGGSTSTSLVASNALPLRSSLRSSVEWPDAVNVSSDLSKVRDATALSAEPGTGSALPFGRSTGPSREELEEARTVWDAMSSLARQASRCSVSNGSPRAASSSKTPARTTATETATVSTAASPEAGVKARPSSADTLANALAAFDVASRPERASSETRPALGNVGDGHLPATEQISASSPLPLASLGSATIVYESAVRSHALVHGTSSTNEAEDSAAGAHGPMEVRRLYNVNSEASNSLVCSPVVGLAALSVSNEDNDSHAVTSVSEDGSGVVGRENLSQTLKAVIVISTNATSTSSPPSSARLQRERHATAAYQRRGRSQSILQVAPANEKDMVAVKLIMAYFRRFKARKQLAARLAQQQHEREEQKLAQQRRVCEQRVVHFVWSLVQRRRTRKAVAAAKREKQREAMMTAAAEAERGATASSSAAAAKANAGKGKALTSRERLQLAKEQREAMRKDSGGAGAASSATARLPATPSPSTATAAATSPSVAPIVATVPSLPLAENGITTNAIANYNRDGDSFEVAVLHRLLLAPKALLFAVRMAIDAYPMRPPMAYAKAPEDIRRGDTSISPERASQTPERDDPEGLWNTKRTASGSHSAPDSVQDGKDRQEGVFRVPYAVLRPYVTYYAELSAPSSSTCVTSGTSENAQSAAQKQTEVQLRNALGGASAALQVPRSVRYDSFVDVDELRHETPVVKPFARPFENWGSAHNLVRRTFTAAAMYAWKLIFSHTPHDDYKQRQLRGRDEQAARLDRVDQRNRMILACYAVHSEREWLREASKDLSFVGQIFNPKRSMDPNDPDLERHCRETYEFVEDFLYQCFPTVSSLDEVPSFLVGAGLFFVLKEVFQWRADAPDSAVVLKQVPGWVLSCDQLTAPRRAVQAQRETFLDAHPDVAMFHDGHDTHSKNRIGKYWLVYKGPTTDANAELTKFNAQPVDMYLTGFQHFEMLRYEQLSLLQRIARWIYEQRPATEPKVNNVFSPLLPQQSMEVTTSLTQTSAASAAAQQFLSRRAGGTDDHSALAYTVPDALSDSAEAPVGAAGMRYGSSATSPSQLALATGEGDGSRRRFSDTPGADELHLLHASVSGASLIHDRLTESTRAGADFVTSVLGSGTGRHQKQLTPAERRQDAEEAKKEKQILPVKLVAIPSTALQAVKQKQQQQHAHTQGTRTGGATSSTSSTPSRHALGGASAPDRRFVCDYEHEQFIKQRQQKVSAALSRYLEGIGSTGAASEVARTDKLSRKITAASTVETEKASVPGSEFMLVYPKNFLVDLSEKLTYELLGLRLHLSVCEELDAV